MKQSKYVLREDYDRLARSQEDYAAALRAVMTKSVSKTYAVNPRLMSGGQNEPGQYRYQFVERKNGYHLVIITYRLKGQSDQISVGRNDKHAIFQCGHRLIVSALLTGNFPDWDRVLPKKGERNSALTFETAPAIKALDRVEVFADERSKAVRLETDVASTKLTIWAEQSDTGKAKGAIAARPQSAGQMFCGLNLTYARDFLRVATGDVTLRYNQSNAERPTKDSVVFADEAGAQYLVMPMRI